MLKRCFRTCQKLLKHVLEGPKIVYYKVGNKLGTSWKNIWKKLKKVGKSWKKVGHICLNEIGYY